MRSIPFLLAAVLMLPMFAGANACEMTTTTPDVDLNTGISGAPRFYVDNDVIQTDGPIFSIWVYEESNGIDGLQRRDEIVDDTCNGAAGASDTIIL